MAKATNLAGSAGTKTMQFKHTAAVAQNDIILLGLRILIAVGDSLANAMAIYIHGSQKVEVPKNNPEVWAAGEVIYWDDTAKEFTTVVGANTKCGMAVMDAASADTLGYIELDNSVNY